ncbi:MAG: hypothetical protein H6591_08625 [Flavobacteriales bacterium]|nr:hypothetical protein [Flavobacteriales bacterium]
MSRSALLSLLFVLTASSTKALSVAMGALPETCGNVNGAAWGIPSGGVPPYTYSWTGPAGFTSTADSIYALEAGTYTLVVTDNVGSQVSQSAGVQDLSALPPGPGGCASCAGPLLGYGPAPCEGMCNGAFAFNDSWLPPGTVNLTYSFPGNNPFLGLTSYGEQVFGNFCYGETVTYTFTDDMGCSGTTTFEVYGLGTPDQPVISQIQGACSGGNGGSFQISMPTQYQADLTLSLAGSEVATYTSFGSGTHLFSNLVAGTYNLLTHWNLSQCAHSDVIVIPDLGPNCNTLTGTSWYDADGDCVQDVNEVGIPGSVLQVEPGGLYTITHDDGSYSLNLPNGNYTLAQSDASLVPICPAALPVPFSMSTAAVNIDLANGSTVPLDLDMRFTTTPARPGFDFALVAKVRNLSPQQSGPVTVTCSFDPALIYTSAQPSPSTVSGNMITWELPAFDSFHISQLQAHFDVPVSTPLGSALSTTFVASNTLPEATLTNNPAQRTSIVTGSFDPNEKVVITSSGNIEGLYQIGVDEWLDYTIRFQNTGTDTAFTVVITDTLDATLDMASFEQGACSHPCTVDFRPGRVVQWTFTDILLPDSNVNEAASHGLTSFRMKLHEPVLPGTMVPNIANIYFDFNPPVITEPSMVVAEFSTGVEELPSTIMRAWPVPTTGLVKVTSPIPVQGLLLLAADGRSVAEYAVDAMSTTIDLQDLPSGVYLLMGSLSDRSVQRLHIIKQ